jgi:hypothetical protein
VSVKSLYDEEGFKSMKCVLRDVECAELNMHLV